MPEAEQFEYIVPEGAKKARIDKILTEAYPDFSRADFHRAFEAKRVFADGVAVSKNRKISSGAVIRFSMVPRAQLPLEPIDLRLPVVYEDDALIVVNKPAGLITHAGAGAAEPPLVHGLLFLCGGNLSRLGGEDRPGIVHRLDRETSGLIAAAKTDPAHAGLAAVFKERSIVKEYLALVCGIPSLLSGSVSKPIERHPAHRHKMRVSRAGEGRDARTDWQLLGTNKARDYALLRCRIHTGRTHQIRVHLQSIGHPILGDATYGFRSAKRLGEPPMRVMLHSEHLAFQHPLTGKSLDFRQSPPDDMQAFMKDLAPQNH